METNVTDTSLLVTTQHGCALDYYDNACRAVAEAKAVDDVKHIIDAAAARKEYARRAKNRQMEADAVEIRLRATRRLGELIKAQKETVGLATGREGKRRALGLEKNPSDRPTLAEAGIDKNLAHQARVFEAMAEVAFEEKIRYARDAVSRAVKTVVNSAIIEQQRESYRDRVEQGGTVADLRALAESGKKFGLIYADPPWVFETYSGTGKQRSAERRYATMPLDEIKALPVAALGAPASVLFLWAVCPDPDAAREVIKAWGFDYKTVGLAWIKTTKSAECISLNGDGLHWGMGYHTRSNMELCLLATRGSPTRLAADVHQIIIAPVAEHSEKPEEARRRIERLYPGPYLELFARRERPGWTTWGN
jgi:N6-adenosine-specific RNA methylase IME4